MTTRAEIRAEARALADQENSTFPTDAQYNTYINNAIRAVVRKMIRAGWNPDRTILQVSATGDPFYSIGTDVSVVTDVYRVTGGRRVAVPRAKPETAPAMEAYSTGEARGYLLVGGALTDLQLHLFPASSVGEYEVHYVKRFEGLSSDSAHWYGPEGSAELVAILAAIDGKDKEGDDTRALQEKAALRWREVSEQAGWLDAKGQQTVRDVTSTGLTWHEVRAVGGWF